jgi:hypothetical protein
MVKEKGIWNWELGIGPYHKIPDYYSEISGLKNVGYEIKIMNKVDFQIPNYKLQIPSSIVLSAN